MNGRSRQLVLGAWLCCSSLVWPATRRSLRLALHPRADRFFATPTCDRLSCQSQVISIPWDRGSFRLAALCSPHPLSIVPPCVPELLHWSCRTKKPIDVIGYDVSCHDSAWDWYKARESGRRKQREELAAQDADETTPGHAAVSGRLRSARISECFAVPTDRRRWCFRCFRCFRYFQCLRLSRRRKPSRNPAGPCSAGPSSTHRP